MVAGVMNCWNEEPERLLISIRTFRSVYPGADVHVIQDGKARDVLAQLLAAEGVVYTARGHQCKNFELAAEYTRGWMRLVRTLPPPVFKFDPDTVFYAPLPVFPPETQYAGRPHASGQFLFGGCILVGHVFAEHTLTSSYATAKLARGCCYWRGFSEDLFLAALARAHEIPLTPCSAIFRYRGVAPPSKTRRLYSVSIKSGDAIRG